MEATPFSILLVDDDPLVIRVLSRMLAEFAPLRFATSGAQALQLARETLPDLILLDVDMPDMSGFDVCKALKADTRLVDVPVIFLSSHDNARIQAMGVQAGGVDFITKPPHGSLVLTRIRTQQRMKSLTDTLQGTVSLDCVTGSSNRRHLEKTLLQELQRARRSALPLSLLLVGIDGVDAYSEPAHDAADSVVQSVAQALKPILKRPADLFARFTHSQFALLAPETALADAQQLALRCLQVIDDLQLERPNAPGHLSVSVSVVCSTQTASMTPSDAADALLVSAEQALITAMHAGGHRCAGFAELRAELHVAQR